MKYRILRYGVFRQPEAAGLVADEIERCRLLWNALVRIERDNRAALAAMSEDPAAGEAYRAARDRADALAAEIKTRRKAARGRANVDDLRGELKAAREARKAAALAAKEARAAWRETNQDAMAELEKARREKVKAAYNAPYLGQKLYWGNYNSVLEGYNTARVRAMRDGVDLRFRRRDNWNGSLSVLATSDPKDAARCLLGTHPLFNLTPGHGVNAYNFRLRIGTGEGGVPLWVTGACRVHRPLAVGLLRRVKLVRGECGGKPKWWLVLTVEQPAETAMRGHGGIAGVDIGWRKTDSGTRVGYWACGDGANAEALCPASVGAMLDKANAIQGVVDVMANEFKTRLLRGIEEAALPPGVSEKLKALQVPLWRSSFRLARFAKSWVRVPGDEPIWDAICWQAGVGAAHGQDYAARHGHLTRYAAGLRRHATGRRREHYRVEAKRILAGASVLALEAFDLRAFARKEPAGSETDYNTRAQRAVAAPSEFRRALLDYAKREGIEVRIFPAENTTKRHAACGKMMNFDQASEVMFRCEWCGGEGDQDHNAALNLLALAADTGDADTGRSQTGPQPAENEPDGPTP